MYIKKIVVEGFKSYKDHTVIDGFDPNFNAITGMNGTGKSNILDSICFVLGISTLSHVRATNLSDLIFKNGQAGIKKAKVEITFSNKDKELSPINYKSFSEIIVCREIVNTATGTNSKFYINGQVKNQKDVLDLFRSVRLNVNNPHFLVQQGRIEKVINMSPKEVLEMIEESAGIRMFEDKKDESLKTLHLKQHQLDEIDNIITNQLEPNLEKLRHERDECNRCNHLSAECAKLQRWVVAFEFEENDKIVKSAEDNVQKKRKKLQEAQQKQAELSDRIKQITEQIEELSQRKQSDERSRLSGLKEQLDKLDKEIRELKSTLSNAESMISRYSSNTQQKSTDLAKLKADYETKERQLQQFKFGADAAIQNYEQAQKTLEEVQTRLQNLEMDIDGTNDRSLPVQLEDDRQALDEVKVRLATITNSIETIKGELANVQSQHDAELSRLTSAFEQAVSIRDDIQQRLKALNFDEAREGRMAARKQEIERELPILDQKIDTFKAHYPTLDVPQRDGIRGAFGILFDVKDYQYITAVEVAAGGKIFYVVVDQIKVGQDEIKRQRQEAERKGLQPPRVSFIPLDTILGPNEIPNIDKIASEPGEKRKSDTKSEILREQTHLALRLVNYDSSLAPGAKYVFGNTLICDSIDTSDEVAKRSNQRVVTLAGDAIDPHGGTLTGGHRRLEDSVLPRIKQFKADIDRRASLLQEYEVLTQELKNFSSISIEYHDLKGQLEIAQHDVDLAQESLDQFNRVDKGAQLEQQAKDSESQKAALEKRERELTTEIASIEAKLQDWEQNKREKRRQLERHLVEAREKVSETKEEKDRQEGILNELMTSQDLLKDQISSLQDDLSEQEKRMSDALEKQKNCTEKLEKAESKREELLEDKAKYEANILSIDTELKQCADEEKETTKQLNEIRIKNQKLQQKLDEMIHAKDQAKEKRKQLLEDYPWIAQEQRLFGVKHSDFDFSQHEPKEAKRRLEELETEVAELEQTVNKRAVVMFERAEAELTSLKEKKRIVEDEKEKITQIIQELEEKEREALNTTYHKVNVDFNAISSQLVAGACGSLEPMEGQTIFEGLSIQVKLGDVQVPLMELSGGQRSLIALALLMSLLKFQPAPIYILDEIDQALDLDNTQNIGRIIRRSFKSTQFIIVSHKMGLWDKANVLFRTNYNGSTSGVTREEHRSAQ